jgi:succinate-semialdehyde dehydrogenase/glutarate-semialdehyde dehydrogenase
MTFTTINPYDQRKINSYKTFDQNQVKDTIEKAHETFLKFRHKKPSSRSDKMLKVAEILKTNKTKYASQITREMGKPITQSIAEIEKCAMVCEYYAQNAEELLKADIVKTDANSSYVTKEAIGVIFSIMPWNYPFWQVFRVLAPNIMLGNGLIVKHSPNTLGCAEMISEIIDEAGFAPNTFSHIIIEVDQVESVIAHRLIKGVTFTGSTKAGSKVAALAGKHIKKSVLELGGSNAMVVFEDADLERTAEECVKARFQNTGQSCIAGKRLMVQEYIYEEFIEKIKTRVHALQEGNPNEENTYISVLAREDLAENLNNQLKKSIKMGAKLTSGGHQDKTYFEPTLVENVTTDMPIFKEETFGPLLAIIPFKSDEDAIKLINQSDFGLGASIFTNNEERFDKLAHQLDDGAVFMNAMVKSQPKLPFGGTKNSGYGRELGKEGILEFANIKTIYKQQNEI